jgi:uncharacterized protein (TIGR03437 family)
MRTFAYSTLGLVLVGGALLAAPDVHTIAQLPLRFEPVTGTSRFIARGNGYSLDIQAREHTLQWVGTRSLVSLRTRFPGAQAKARIQASGLLSSRTNYFTGSSAKTWRTDVPNYERVRITDLFPGIDLDFHGENGSLEYDFILHPGAQPSAIRFVVDGPHHVRVDENGDLVLARGKDRALWKAPVLYQMKDGQREPVEGRFVVDVKRHTVRFAVGRYDHTRELVIDPALSYASYLGGTGKELARGVATDSAGNVYVSGGTTSTNLTVTPGVAQPKLAAAADAYVAKFSPAGALIYTTFLGGHRTDYSTGIAVDGAGNAYVTGMTNSTDFPVSTGAYQGTYGGSGGNTCQTGGDAFVTKLNPSGSQLLYSTYLGGNQDDIGSGIAIDSSGNAYIAGSTLSRNFPISSGAFQMTFAGSGGQTGKPPCNGYPWFNSGDVFVTKLNPAGTQLVFSTYLGGSFDDSALAVAVDSSQNVYVGGFTLSHNLPVTAGAYQSSFHGSDYQNEFFNSGDGFVGKLASSGASLVYLTYLGGSGDDAVTALYPMNDGSVWVAGSSSSQDFPVTAGAVQKSYVGYLTLPFLIEQNIGDGIAAHINPSGSELLYSTYFGGSQNDMATAIGVDAAGLVYLAGYSDSTSAFPITSDALQPRMAGDGGSELYFNYGDGFVAVINPAAGALVYSSYYGGSLDDEFFAMCLDGKGGVWATGNTVSNNLPVTSSASQPKYGGQTGLTMGTWGDAMLVHFTGLGVTGPFIGAIQNSASSASGSISPGMIFTIYGSDIGPSTLVGASVDSAGKLATTQAGYTITFNGVPAPIVYVSATQSAGIVPYEVAGQSSANIVVSNGTQSSPAMTVPVVAAVPGLFSLNQSGSGEAVAYNQDLTLNSASNPAAKGSVIVVYGTGEGQTNPPGVTGFIAVPGNVPAPAGGCKATVGGLPATVNYCGAVPYVVTGEIQLNLQLSPNVASGSQPVMFQVGSASSQANLTVYVK